MNRKKVAVGLSGGVDSAVSAWLLKQEGYDVVGVHLYCWPPKSEIVRDGITREEWIKKNGCRADEDRASALKTALEIGIPFKELDFSEEYNDRVIKYFYETYQAGRTPNPDVLCNSEIKFGLFLEWALQNGFDYIATGHYAKINNFESVALRNPETKSISSDLTKLFVPKDKHKDQTYFLWKLTQKELSSVLFPLGDYLKGEVREIAKKANLTVASKKDSQGICFVGNVEVREFLKRRLAEKEGEVVNIRGEVIGKHKGVAFYTIGERGGWEILPGKQKLKAEKTQVGDVTPIYYIVDKDARNNRLIVGEKNDVMSKKIIIEDISLIDQIIGESEADFLGGIVESGLFVRIRHGGEINKVKKIKIVKTQGKELLIETENDVFGVASGQSAVFYTETGECLGGGVIV